MDSLRFRIFTCLLAAGLLIDAAQAQNPSQPAYLNPNLPAETRAADLVGRMTREEKASQLINDASAIPRLQVPAYNWWSEALHGVAVKGATSFPEPIALGATFDPAGIHEMGVAIGTEARIEHEQALKANGGSTGLFQGLDFWAPNINIFRDPRWGRGQETYGEDPFLTARMGVAYVTGMQGEDPHYYRVIATPKHFAVHSGPEPTRHSVDVSVSKHDEMDTYLPAFRATITEAKAGSIMCAYNSVNGQPACANDFLLKDMLRSKWAFQGYVVSDCDAVTDIFNGHHYRPSQPESSAISLITGMDNECGFTPAASVSAFVDAAKKGYLSEKDMGRALVRLFTARMKLGEFDPPERVSYSKIDPSELDGAAYRALALKLANESMVLLKNNGVLPLKRSGARIALIGPLADQTRVLLGNYNGTPTHTVSILEGLRKEFAADTITYVPGTWFLNEDMDIVPGRLLRSGGAAGVKAEYSLVQWAPGPMIGGIKSGAVVAARIEKSLDTEAMMLPSEVAHSPQFAAHWETTLTPDETGDFSLGVRAVGLVRMSVDGKRFLNFRSDDIETHTASIHLEKDKPLQVVVDFNSAKGSKPTVRLLWRKDEDALTAAVDAAKMADVVVAVAGITSQLEGEEMEVSEPGFKGGDRTSLDLPQPEMRLLQALADTGKPMVVVLTNGSALGITWANEHASAILDAWYPGEEGGTAVAQTLSGTNNPAGRLPVTFYAGVDQLPPFEDYSMKGRTYRYFQGKPLYPFGYGLSYTNFRYSELKVPSAPVKAGGPAVVEATVTNAGMRPGDEVMQLYLSFPSVPGAPLRALRGFRRVHLEAGASTTVRFELSPRDMSMVTENGEPIVADGTYSISIGGGQPNSGAPAVNGKFQVSGTINLPE